MAADQTFLWSHGKPQESVPLQDFNITEGQDCNAETWHVTFRAFTGSEESDPVEDLRRLQELCHLWLRPDVHTKDQILDKLVMEQFMISMPQELQVLVKESGVDSCKDLEDMLRSNAKPKKWTVVSLQGQKFLLRNSDVVMAEAEVSDTDDVTDLSRKPPSSVSKTEIHPENSQKVFQKLENVPRIDEMSRGQRILQSNLSKESVRAEDGKNLQEATCIKNVDADVPCTHGSETEVLTQSWKGKDSWSPRDPQRRKQGNTSIPQEVPQGAMSLDTEEFSRQLRSNSKHSPITMGPFGHSVRKEATRQTPYECGTCKKRFNYESQLNVHQRTHTGDRPFKCMVCLKGFMQSSDLRVHQRVHTGEKPYTCKVCFKQFTHDSTLRSHQRVHTNEKPYQCEVCDKHFNHKGNLNVHLRTHSGAKPYLCHQCHQDFRQLGTLKRHQKTHLKVTTQRFCHQAQVPSAQEGN
ncbi:zinc finger and SCAN domain-containing protein 5B [Pteropus alecto]|uniref:zinc finger and SCAN domain-containing protein 5B n=1 Tax=Pteropus alecto TaxID=9402 RepID=UPI000D53A702|nr:zinc finger and SCAN domain-containing protein 5B [Pteropus alecto]